MSGCRTDCSSNLLKLELIPCPHQGLLDAREPLQGPTASERCAAISGSREFTRTTHESPRPPSRSSAKPDFWNWPSTLEVTTNPGSRKRAIQVRSRWNPWCGVVSR